MDMEQQRFEKTSSINTDFNAQGLLKSFSIKIYFDVDEKSTTEITDKINELHTEIKKRF
uniref:Uncharacterized protein n=1 Tax=viral metagenome TaxID=1070528 RepID=A0A6M3JIK9_9ZZZZ